MNRLLYALIKALNGIVAVGIVLAGGLFGWAALSPGVLAEHFAAGVGGLIGALVAAVVCGTIALLIAIEQRLGSLERSMAGVGGERAVGSVTSAVRASEGPASNGAHAPHVSNGGLAPVARNGAAPDVQAGVEAGAAKASDAIDPTLNDLLSSGRFSEFHLMQAKRAFASRDLKVAREQVGAALAHDGRNEAARLLRGEIRKARSAGP